MMKNTGSILTYRFNLLFIAVLIVFAFAAGYFLNFYQSSLQQPLIVQWIDGKYGQKFYGVEIFARKSGKKYDVYCDVLISPQTGNDRYYHSIGRIGSEDTLDKVTEKYSDIRINITNGERFLFIGNEQIASMQDIESHR